MPLSPQPLGDANDLGGSPEPLDVLAALIWAMAPR